MRTVIYARVYSDNQCGKSIEDQRVHIQPTKNEVLRLIKILIKVVCVIGVNY